MSIYVTKSFLPPKEEYLALLNKIWESNWLTNDGPLLLELESKLSNFLNIKDLLFVSNGTIALQIAIKALSLKGEIITTPFSYCATTTSILWENCKPVYADINEYDLNINVAEIEKKITSKTSAILATHVYGNPCDVAAIEAIAQKHNIAVIYDGAHAFGVKLNGKSLLSYGDISTCSFHATKVFHTSEGGAVMVNKNKALYDKISLFRSFGHKVNDVHISMGINAKNSEFHAAMGLANLPYLKENIAKRKNISELYSSLLDSNKITRPYSQEKDFHYNYAYYPVIFKNEVITEKIIKTLNDNDIFPRRYFYPSLNVLSYLKNKDKCPISESVSNRVLALPLYPELEQEQVVRIAEIINKTV